MAATSKPSAAIAAAVILLLVATSLLATAEASSLTAFSGPGCSGRMKRVTNVCGCYDISGYQGGFDFTLSEGQQANLHIGRRCDYAHPLALTKSVRYCHRTGFDKVNMLC